MKALIPAAGLGTRLLPATKVIPKALWPIGNKPAIQWVLEEMVSSGLTECVIVLSLLTKSVKEYLRPLPESDPRKVDLSMVTLEQIVDKLCIQYVFQEQPYGLGHAILKARKMIGDSHFALILPDMIWAEGRSPLFQLVEVHRKHGEPCIALHDSYGLSTSRSVYRGAHISEKVVRIENLQRKEGNGDLRGMYAGLGRAVLLSETFAFLKSSWSKVHEDFDESAALLGFIRKKSLLGVLVDPPTYHLGAQI